MAEEIQQSTRQRGPVQLRHRRSAVETFLTESEAMLQRLQQNLDQVAASPHNEDSQAALLATFTSIKDGAAELSLFDMQDLAHESEFLLDAVHKRDVVLTDSVLDCLRETHQVMLELRSKVSEALAQETLLAPTSQAARQLERLRQQLMSLLLSSRSERSTVSVPRVTTAPPSEPHTVSTESTVSRLQLAVDELAERHGAMLNGVKWSDELSPDKKKAMVVIQQQIGALKTMISELDRFQIDELSEALTATVEQSAQRCGKKVRLQLDGGATMIPRSMQQPLQTALTQLVRNAVVHGIETSSFRVEAAKAAEGLVHVSVSKQDRDLVIEVLDDGHGLDEIKIRDQAHRLRLHDRGASENAVDLIFVPGLSTVDRVTPEAGRGIGLESVQRAITELGGSIACSSTPAKGCRFTIRLKV